MKKNGITLTEKDANRIQAMLIWFEKQRKKTPIRRRGSTSGAGVQKTIFGVVLRGLLYADPVGLPPGGISEYIIALKSDNVQAWDKDADYKIGNKCHLAEIIDGVFTPRIYRAVEVNNNSSPPASCWELEDPISPKGLCLEAEGYGVTATDLRYTDRWYHVGDEVPMLKINNVYYFEDVVVPVVNTSGEGSLRWNEDEQRLMAVYR